MKRLLSLVIFAVLIITPLQALAQDGPELQDYTSEDGLFTAAYPADWQMQVDDTIPFPNLILLNSEEALARWNADETPTSGDIAVNVLVVPVDFLTLLQIEVPTDYTNIDLADAFASLMMGPEATQDQATPADEVSDVVIGDSEEITLAEDMLAGYVRVSDSVSEGSIIIRQFDATPGVIAVAVSFTLPGEYSDAVDQVALDIATSLDYSGSADDLMAVLMGGPVDSGSSDSGSTVGDTGATLDGAALVQERCTVCHSAGRIDQADKDEAGWTSTVDRMISHGAQLNADERQAVIDYLVATH